MNDTIEFNNSIDFTAYLLLGLYNMKILYPKLKNICRRRLKALKLPFPKRQILDSSKLKAFADINFRFNKNDAKFSKMVKKTVGKGEIAVF